MAKSCTRRGMAMGKASLSVSRSKSFSISCRTYWKYLQEHQTRAAFSQHCKTWTVSNACLQHEKHAVPTAGPRPWASQG